MSGNPTMLIDNRMSARSLAVRYPDHIPVYCVRAGDSSKNKAHQVSILVSRHTQVAALKAALQETLETKKAVQVFVDGALPSKDTEVYDLCVDGAARLTYSMEGMYGGTIVATPCGGAGTW